MNFYNKISLLLALFVGVIIFCWSAVPGFEGSPGFNLLPIIYHVGIFFLLGSFLFLAAWDNFKESSILIVILISLAYAASDELHQFFVPNRGCSITDFGIDSFGILISLGFVLFFRLFRKKRILNKLTSFCKKPRHF